MAWKRASFTKHEFEQYEIELGSLKRSSRFLADENIAPEKVSALRRRGLNIKSVIESNLSGREDAVIWNLARREDRILITSDRDFLDDSQFPIDHSPGVVVLPSSSQSTDIIASALVSVIFLVAKHREMWLGTKIETCAHGVFQVRMRNSASGAIQTVKYWFRDEGPPLIWESGD